MYAKDIKCGYYGGMIKCNFEDKFDVSLFKSKMPHGFENTAISFQFIIEMCEREKRKQKKHFENLNLGFNILKAGNEAKTCQLKKSVPMNGGFREPNQIITD